MKKFLSLFFVLLFIDSFAATPFIRKPLSATGNPAVIGFSTIDVIYDMDSEGNTLAVWNIFNGTRTVVQSAYKPKGGANWILPGSPTTQSNIISPINLNVNTFFFEMDEQGNAVVAWVVNNQSTNVIQANYFKKGVGWEGTTTLSEIGFNVILSPQAAINNGHAVVYWQIFNSRIGAIAGNTVAQAAYKPNDGGWQKPGTPSGSNNILSTIGLNVVPLIEDACPPNQVDVDEFGNAVVVWQIFINGNSPIQAAYRNKAGPWIVPGNPSVPSNLISPANLNITTPPTVIVSNKNATILWQLSTGFGTVPGVIQVQAATMVFP